MVVFRFNLSFKRSRPTVIESQQKNSSFICFQHFFQICCPPEKPFEAIRRSSLNRRGFPPRKRCDPTRKSLANRVIHSWWSTFHLRKKVKKQYIGVQASQTCSWSPSSHEIPPQLISTSQVLKRWIFEGPGKITSEIAENAGLPEGLPGENTWEEVNWYTTP